VDGVSRAGSKESGGAGGGGGRRDKAVANRSKKDRWRKAKKRTQHGRQRHSEERCRSLRAESKTSVPSHATSKAEAKRDSSECRSKQITIQRSPPKRERQTAHPTAWFERRKRMNATSEPAASGIPRFRRSSAGGSPISAPVYAQYNCLSMTAGIGLISVPSSCSILYRLNLSSYVMRLMASPRCPKRPERPMRCR